MIEFTSDLEIGIEELDSEHRRLFDLIVKIEVRAITQKANIRAIATLSFSFFRCA